MIIAHQEQKFECPSSVEAAVSMLDRLAGDGALLAGGTWLMRAPLRDEASNPVFVSLAKIPALRRIDVDGNALQLGALVTHHDLAGASGELSEMTALTQAAQKSANPAIRRMATLGGNICAQGFEAADLVPALLALGARVDVVSINGADNLKLENYVEDRKNRPHSEILTSVTVPRQSGKSSHARGLRRQAGEYPVANVSIYLELDDNGLIAKLRIAVGAVEATAKRWRSLEQALLGKPLQPAQFTTLAQSCSSEFKPRNGVDAPGSYRLRILPRLVELAFADLESQIKGAP